MSSRVPSICTKSACCAMRFLVASAVSSPMSRTCITSADAISSSVWRPSSTSAIRVSTRPAISPARSSESMHEMSACIDEPTAVRSIQTGRSARPYSCSFFMIVSIASTESRVCMSSCASTHSKEDARRKATAPTERAAFSTLSWSWPRVSRPELRTRMSSAIGMVAAWKRRKCAPSSPSSSASFCRMANACERISSVRPTVRLSQSAMIETMLATSCACRLSMGTSRRHSITRTFRSSSGASSAWKSTCSRPAASSLLETSTASASSWLARRQ